MGLFGSGSRAFPPGVCPGGRPLCGLGALLPWSFRPLYEGGESRYVVHEHAPHDCSLRPGHADSPYEQSHASEYEPVNMLDPGADVRLLPVVPLLFIGERMVAVALLADDLLVSLRQGVLAVQITAVRMDSLHVVLVALGKLAVHVAVVHAGVGDHRLPHELVLHVHQCVELVAEVVLPTFLHPAGVGILLPQFVRDLFPFLGDIPLLDCPVFFGGIALARGLHDGGVNDGAFLGLVAGLLQYLVERPYQLVPGAGFLVLLEIVAYGVLVGYDTVQAHADKAHEGKSVLQLVFHLFEGKVVEMLEYQHLEHRARTEALAPGVAVALACLAAFFLHVGENVVKFFPVDNLVKSLQRIALL